MRLLKTFIVVGLIAFVSASSVAFGQQETERRPSRSDWTYKEIKAKVESVDYEKREVLLRGPKGDLLTVKADEAVKRFNEIKAGDNIKTGFWVYMEAQFRDPTPEEKAVPLVVLVEAGKASESLPPEAAVGAVVKAVVSVEIINRPDMVVTVKGPRGNYAAIPVKDTALIEQLQVGEVIVLTYAEAVAISLEKVEANL
jgi:hypothetical protein